MKKFVVTIFLSAGLLVEACGCDVCGCSLGGNYFGILPMYNRNFVGVRWSQASFNSYISPTQYLPAQHSHDTYSKAELWGRYYLAERVQLFMFVPYVYNNMDGTDQRVFAQGLGDINIMANYVIINTGEINDDLKQTLIAGGGLKLPTGRFSLTDNGKIINRNFQMGTGSVDFNLNTVYTVRYKKLGINLETGYKINTRNHDGYLFGNQYRASAQLFYWRKIGPLSILPHAGMNYEQAAVHHDNEIIQVNTGGSAALAAGGMDIYLGRFTAGVNYQKPVVQHYNSDETADIISNARWTVSLTYNF